MNISDSASSSSPQQPTVYEDPVATGAAVNSANSALAPTKNPVGTVAFVLTLVMIASESSFNLTVNLVIDTLSFDEVQIFLFTRALISLVLAFVVVILATVSLILRGRQKVLGAIALGAGGYALLMALFVFVGNAIAAVNI